MAETVTGRAAAHAKLGQYVGRIVKPLSHPFLLLVVGALLTSLLLPSITRRWQDHQRRLDLQDQLVSEITREATKFIVAAHHAHDQKLSARPAVETWKVESAVIQSRLFGYYPTDINAPRGIAGQWSHYVIAANAFHQVALGKQKDRAKNRKLLCSELRMADVATCGQFKEFDDFVRWMENLLSLLVRDILEEPPRV